MRCRVRVLPCARSTSVPRAAPVAGRDDVVAEVGAQLSAQPVPINGGPALLLRLNGKIDAVVAIRVNDRLITGLHFVRNPESFRVSGMKRP